MGRPLLLPCVLVLVLSLCGRAGAQQMPQNVSGEVQFRGNYWRDRNTRVLNPTVDVERDLPSGVKLGAHYVLDAITSASVAAGAAADKPFTELRHEAGFRAEVPLSRRVRLGGNYSYSTESDYFSHNVGLRLNLSLFQDNTTLLFGLDYGHNQAAKRVGPVGYLIPPPVLSPTCATPEGNGSPLCKGILHTVHGVALWNQVFTPTLLGSLSYELSWDDGYHDNPYRPVFVNNQRQEVENLPAVRLIHVVAATVHALVPLPGRLVNHLTFRPGFRFHADSWGLKAVHPELATYVPVGPVEFRVLFSYYRQFAVDFYRSEGGGRSNYYPDTPSYATGPVMRDGEPVYTSDVKLGDYSTYTGELQLRFRLGFLRKLCLVGDILSRTMIDLTGGLWFADRAVGWQFGIPLTADDPQAPAGCSGVCAAVYGSLGLNIPI